MKYGAGDSSADFQRQCIPGLYAQGIRCFFAARDGNGILDRKQGAGTA